MNAVRYFKKPVQMKRFKINRFFHFTETAGKRLHLPFLSYIILHGFLPLSKHSKWNSALHMKGWQMLNPSFFPFLSYF